MDELSPTSLQAFRTAIEAGTFRRAAERLAVSQPAISGHVHRIEAELGVELFQRPYRRVLQPTEAGKLVYRHAVTVSTQNEALRRSLGEFTTGQAGTIQLGLSVSAGRVMTMLAAYYGRSSQIALVVRSGSNARVIELLTRGELDIALAYRTDHPDILCTPFLREPLLFLVAGSHPLAGRTPLRAGDLAGQAFITGMENTRHNVIIHDALQAMGLTNYSIAAQVEDPYHMLALIKTGIGIGAVSYSLAEEAIQHGTVVPLEIEGMKQVSFATTYLLRHKGVQLSPTVQRFLVFLNQDPGAEGLPLPDHLHG